MQAPRALHDVLGESPSGREVAAMLAFGIGTALWLILGLRAEVSGLPWWRVGVAAVLIADIAAGSVANFTRSTNDYYAARPRHRWAFIAVHVHVVLVAAALGAELAPAFAVWAYTVVAASIVNALAGSATQRFVAAMLLAAALAWIPQLEGVAPALVAVHCLFVLKVAYAFAVDHRADARASVPLR